MSNLEKAARQAIALICSARLCDANSASSRREMLGLLIDATDVLRTGLEQVEPVVEAAVEAAKPRAMPEASDRAHVRWDRPCYKCKSYYCGLSCKEQVKQAEPVAEQAEPVFEIGFGWLVAADQYPRGTKLYAAPPHQQQAEPVAANHKRATGAADGQPMTQADSGNPSY